MNPPSALRSWRVRGATALVALAVAAGCSDPPARTAEGYCGAVQAHAAAISGPIVDTEAQIDATVEAYRDITRRAPAAVAPEWRLVLENITLAAETDISDPEALQHLADSARIAQPAYTRIQQYTAETCGVRIDTALDTSPAPATTAAATAAAPSPSSTAAP